MATAKNGHFVWYELMTKDPTAAIAFYGEVVGWKTEPFGADYTMWAGSQGPLGGVMVLPEQAVKMGAPPHWMGSVQVDDVDATTRRAEELGGKVYVEPKDIPEVGRIAVLGDPQGAVIEIFKPGRTMELHDAAKEGEFCWRELMTTDSSAAFSFYSALFGWKIVEDMSMGDMGTYRIFGVGDDRVGGMMTIPKGTPMPTAWLYYTSTHDLDGAIARAKKMGAKVLSGPMEIPGNARIVQMMDAQGAAFALHEEAKKK